MLRELLELYGQFEFEIAPDGCAAVEKLAGELPDLILLDLRLPGLSGLNVLEAIRQVDSRLPVIIVSAYGDKCTRLEATRRGASDFFQKPFSTLRLYRRIRQLLAAATVERQAEDTLILEGEAALRLARQRRLLKLKERQALLGLDAPPELLIEIEDLERELKDAHS